MLKFAVGLTAAAVLAGCSISPKDYETTPVVVQTAAGPVTCQLYRHDLVTWDRSIDRPAQMSVTAADQICLNEGQREKDGKTTVVVAAPAAKAL